MKIAIITFHRAYNCGALLQAWALKTVLERMGHTVEFPILNHVGETKRWLMKWGKWSNNPLRVVRSVIYRGLYNLMSIPAQDILRHRYNNFRINYLPEREITADELGNYYDAIVVGSDQVWSVKHSGKDAPIFFAENIPDCIRKIAYAASYGDKPLDNCAVGRVVDSLQRFSDISVREQFAQLQLSKYTSKPIEVTLDPTLLLSAADYMSIETRIRNKNRPYLFMYTLTAEPFFINIARQLANRLGVRCVIAPCYQYTKFAAPKGLTFSLSPDRLLGLIHDAKYVLAASFHGTALSVLYNKPFLSLRAQEDIYESRPSSFLNLLGCKKRLVNPSTSLNRMVELLKEEIPLSCHEKLEKERAKSLAWLKKCCKN